MLGGYGLTNYVWKLHNVKTIIQVLPTHLVLTALTAAITMVLVVLLVAAALLFSLWVFRKTALENIQEG